MKNQYYIDGITFLLKIVVKLQNDLYIIIYN